MVQTSIQHILLNHKAQLIGGGIESVDMLDNYVVLSNKYHHVSDILINHFS